MALFLWIFLSIEARPQEASQNSDRLKAAFIYNFLKYASWPESSWNSGDISVVIVDSPGVFSELELICRGKIVLGKRVHVFQPSSLSGSSQIHLVYLGGPSGITASDVLRTVKNKPVLIVGTEEFNYPELMITFFQEESRLRFDVKLPAIESSKIELSSQLLKLARLSK